MASSNGSSSGNDESWLANWEDSSNFDNLNETEKTLRTTYTFDDFKGFNDEKILSLQNRSQFFGLFELLKFPCLPFFNSIFQAFNCQEQRFKAERFLQRRICPEFCNYDPSKCFLEDCHSGKLVDLMQKDFHHLYNPDFKHQFPKVNKIPKLVYENHLYPPNVSKFVEKLGISSVLVYNNETAVNNGNLAAEVRKRESPLFTFEEKKVHDIIEALIDVTADKQNDNKALMEKKFNQSLSSDGDICKPLLSLMMWGPQTNVQIPSSVKVCKLTFDPDQEKLHVCNYFLAEHYWTFNHGEQNICTGGQGEEMKGPAMSKQLSVVYPCSRGKCAVDCICELCEKTRNKMCQLENHKTHLKKFTTNCLVQKSSQCQEHWVSHPKKFNQEEDILVEKNIYFHNNQIVDNPRSYAVEIIRLSGIKKTCQFCRKNVENHFKHHMVYHLQCKICLYQIDTLTDIDFWAKVCEVCGKVMSKYSPKQINWHMKLHDPRNKFECPVCELVLKRKYTLERHIKNVHGDQSFYENVGVSSSDDSDEEVNEEYKREESNLEALFSNLVWEWRFSCM